MKDFRVLEPDSRSLLSELLRPPAGFHLAHAVGTSFTMSLEAALAIPLAFAGAVSTEDDVSLLSAVRRATQRIDLFAQAGCLSLGTTSELVTVLEPMVHPVRMRGSQLFHPKVWFLQFDHQAERRYRFICSSRNLTNDRTWDAVVSLDGIPDDDLDAHTTQSNEAMSSLLRWLITKGNTAPQVPAARAARIAALADSWRGIRWEHPEHVRKLRVHAFGIGHRPDGDSGPSLGGIRAAIISPFVTDEGVQRLRARNGGETTLLSRPEAMDRLRPRTLSGVSLRMLDVMVDQALVDSETVPPAASELGGLHAKVVVHDHPDLQSSVLIGSANATGPAWSSNVEVMVEVRGKKSRLGVDAVLGSLAPLIEEYTTPGGAERTPDEQAQRSLENALRMIACTRMVLGVNAADEYTVSVWADDPPSTAQGYTLSWRMLSQQNLTAGPLPTRTQPYHSDLLRLEQITPFIVLVLTDNEGRRHETLVVAELVDDVAGRGDAIIAAHLTEPNAVARFIRLMLQDSGIGSLGAGRGNSYRSEFAAGIADSGAGLLELLVRASATNRAGLADVASVLHHLPDEAHGSALPPGFAEVWAAVMSASGVSG